jgi:hypothetical protein
MTNLLPLFKSVNSMATENRDVLDKIQNDYSVLAIPMLTSARILITELIFTKKLHKIIIFIIFSYNGHDIWYRDWLQIPREDGKPRILFICSNFLTGPLVSSNFIKYIQTVCKIILKQINVS